MPAANFRICFCLVPYKYQVWDSKSMKCNIAYLSNLKSRLKTTKIVEHKKNSRKFRIWKDVNATDDGIYKLTLRKNDKGWLERHYALEKLPKTVWVREVAVGG